MEDFNGRVILIGDKIVYAGRKGSLLWLTHATVLDVFHDTIRVQPTYSNKPVTLRNLYTVAVLGV